MTPPAAIPAWWSASTRRDLLDRYPEWWAYALSTAAWAVLLLTCFQHGAHAIHHRLSWTAELAHWLLMVTAMMLPLLAPQLWLTAVNSLRRRRNQAMGTFFLGFLGPWLLAGTMVAALRQYPWAHTHIAAAFAFFFALLWAATDTQRSAILQCHRTRPLALTSWPAHRDCLHYGAQIGTSCVTSCLPLMLACALSGHSLPALAGGMAVAFIERDWWRVPTQTRYPIFAGLTVWYACWALVSR